MDKRFIKTAYTFYALTFLAIISCSAMAFGHEGSSHDESGQAGGAIGMGIIAAAFIFCGTFFLYKHYTQNDSK